MRARGRAALALFDAHCFSRAALRQCDGADLYKASRSRRGRFLFRLPGNLSPLAGGGRLGTLENMASGEPTMYIEFPEGRLKLRGKLTYPRNRYLSLSIDAKAKKLMCNDAFDVVVDFDSAEWVGLPADNPEERSLPVPASVVQPAGEDGFAFSGASARADGPRASRASAASAASAASSKRPRASGDGEADSSDDVATTQDSSRRRSSRESKRKVDYNDDAAAEDDLNESDESGDD